LSNGYMHTFLVRFDKVDFKMFSACLCSVNIITSHHTCICYFTLKHGVHGVLVSLAQYDGKRCVVGLAIRLGIKPRH